jgi:hypothetical protein
VGAGAGLWAGDGRRGDAESATPHAADVVVVDFFFFFGFCCVFVRLRLLCAMRFFLGVLCSFSSFKIGAHAGGTLKSMKVAAHTKIEAHR